ncbi:DUF3179 domain-containing protein [Candidatus Peregrinibacteria bacterium]|nr:DUF3179 domain-containing protein [Candidatus Peregrinibacteria bacterium]MBI3816017.1 DUF3179 domain-containing protein [Candidatus Peregrinibacteria bacterium]
MQFKPRHIWLFVALVLLLSAIPLARNWDDVKLKLTRFWGYRTIENNPLLPGYDKDVKALNTTQARINLDDLLPGGPPKDGIPALEHPAFDSVSQTPFNDDEKTLGVLINGEAKAYPYGILNWHEIVNDTVGGVPVSVTYCPLCETGIAFERRVDGKETTFGVSGKLFQSCLVMYDRLTNTLWSQPWGMGVVGSHVNESLKRYPALRTTLGLWKKAHPETKVLSANTGYNRDYFRYPYGSYAASNDLIFPVRDAAHVSGRLKDIESIYSEADTQTPENQFSGMSVHFRWHDVQTQKSMTQTIGNRTIEARWDESLQSVRLFENDKELPSTAAFAFVYPAFFP